MQTYIHPFLLSNLENILLIDEPEPAVGRLQIIQSLPHIAISSEYYGFQAFWHIWNLQLFSQKQNTNQINFFS